MQINLSNPDKYETYTTKIIGVYKYESGITVLDFDCTGMACAGCIPGHHSDTTQSDIGVYCSNIINYGYLPTNQKQSILQMCKDSGITLTFEERLVLCK